MIYALPTLQGKHWTTDSRLALTYISRDSIKTSNLFRCKPNNVSILKPTKYHTALYFAYRRYSKTSIIPLLSIIIRPSLSELVKHSRKFSMFWRGDDIGTNSLSQCFPSLEKTSEVNNFIKHWLNLINKSVINHGLISVDFSHSRNVLTFVNKPHHKWKIALLMHTYLNAC